MFVNYKRNVAKSTHNCPNNFYFLSMSRHHLYVDSLKSPKSKSQISLNADQYLRSLHNVFECNKKQQHIIAFFLCAFHKFMSSGNNMNVAFFSAIVSFICAIAKIILFGRKVHGHKIEMKRKMKKIENYHESCYLR